MKRAIEEKVPGAEVQVIQDDSWSTDKITAAGREKLREAGFAPPAPRLVATPVARCTSARTAARRTRTSRTSSARRRAGRSATATAAASRSSSSRRSSCRWLRPPGRPADPEDREGYHQSDQRVGDLNAGSNERSARDNAERYERVDTRMTSVRDQRRALQPFARARPDPRRDGVSPQSRLSPPRRELRGARLSADG